MNSPRLMCPINRVLAGLLIACALLPESGSCEAPGLYGMLESTVEHAGEGRKAGLNVAVISVSWDRFQPRRGFIDKGYVHEILRKKQAFRELGYKLQLDPGVQYPPGWIFILPNARFKNQFGEEFHSDRPGESLPNVVFNAEIRREISAYFQMIFAELGADWDFVRLGGGKYGELNYPSTKSGGHSNCYWAFDDLAQGKSPGLPDGILPCPVAGWIPGTRSPENRSAGRFIEWYLDALRNYQAWQIATVRRDYAGDICMLYGSWGIRPGWLAAAVAGDLGRHTPAEQNGEIQQGYDWSRMIGDLKDPKAIVYCTWVDGTLGNRDLADDKSDNAERWSPVHWQAGLARANPLHLRIWGENTGSNNLPAMAIAFSRTKQFRLMGLVWAFERDLFAEPNPNGLASFREFEGFLRNDGSK